MTVSYTAQVATSSKGLGCFWKLLFRWRGSIYKLVWHEFLVYCFCYATCSMVYRLVLKEDQKRVFEKAALHIEQFTNLIPMAFVLGFYVSRIMTRWWDMYLTIPSPHSLAVYISTTIHGVNDQARVMRRTILRYVNLCLVITLTMISPVVKKRFPTMDHMVDMGLLTEQELNIFQIMDRKTAHAKYWMPLVWAGSIVTKARKEGRIRDDFAVKTIMDDLNNFRSGCGKLLSYDFVCVPLVYTQVITLAVYTFFVCTIFGRQFLDPEQKIPNHSIDLYVPWFTLLQFFFYTGWLKVAESLINPFGEDDDDFEVNSLVDRNLLMSYLIVDEMHADHPELIKDMYFDEVVPQSLPYTVASENLKTTINQGSTAELELPQHTQEILDTIFEEKQRDLNRDKTETESEITVKEATDSIVSERKSRRSIRNASLDPSRFPVLVIPNAVRSSTLSRLIDRITSVTCRKKQSEKRSRSILERRWMRYNQPKTSSNSSTASNTSVPLMVIPENVGDGDSLDGASDILETEREVKSAESTKKKIMF